MRISHESQLTTVYLWDPYARWAESEVKAFDLIMVSTLEYLNRCQEAVTR